LKRYSGTGSLKSKDKETIFVFKKQNGEGYESLAEGVERKTLVFGDKTLMSEFHMKKGGTVPPHSHPHEQTGYLVKGRMRLTIGEETFDVAPGDGWCIPGDMSHWGEVLEDSIAIEVFAPVREDYLPK
jgi:quercetin dioxygenase-like cupin family protein